jgi:phosphatidylinositol alpha-1,6-mannosyltransferase
MKKLLIATIEFPPQKGGIANYLAGLAGAFPTDRVAILAEKNDGTEKFDGAQQYKIYRKKLFSKFFWPKWLPLVWHLRRVARKEKVETILVGQVLPVGTAAMIVKKFLGIPYFVSCHGMDILIAQTAPRKKKLLVKILTEARGVIANSQFTKNELLKIGVAENKITIVYPCPKKFEMSVSAEAIKRKYHLENKKILLTVGRLVRRKGHNKVIEAMPKILEKLPEAIYIVVGGGPEISNLKSQISNLDLTNKVIFTGEIFDEELAAFYKMCDVFIMIPRQIGGDVEGFGTVYLEANQFGKPVVASKSGGAAEAVLDGVTGLIVDSADANQIADAIIKLLTEKELADKLGAEGEERVKKEFQWEIQTEKIKTMLN